MKEPEKTMAQIAGVKDGSWREGQSEAKQLVCSGARIPTQLEPASEPQDSCNSGSRGVMLAAAAAAAVNLQ